MEFGIDQLSESPSKNSLTGSYYKILSIPRETVLPPKDPNPPIDSPGLQPTKQNSQALVDALRTLQKRLETEKSYAQYSRDAKTQEPVAMATGLPVTEGDNRSELDNKLQSAESRCKSIERQLDYMRRIVEGTRVDNEAPMNNQIVLQQQEKQPTNPDNQNPQQKLQKLESECLKLSRTQNLSEMKLAVLEQRLLKEEHERKLVQEKAGQLQRELDLNLRLCSPPAVQHTKPQKAPQKATLKPPSPIETVSPRHKRIPFVAGMSTSPSHSVHANVQSILHMMKHHQPQLCERVSALHRSGCGAKKSLRMDGQPAVRPAPEPQPDAPSLGSLSDLLLALQDELGQMGFEHQELMRQLDASQHVEQRHELQKELESMEARMDKKGAQIIKLRKHQQTVNKLTQQPRVTVKAAKKPNAPRPSSASPIRSKQQHHHHHHHHNRPSSAGQQNLHILRETQKLRNSLKQDDICWEV
ncbi:centrosomal protein CEP57L1 isoform X2 [Syngnathoides biaculeatus]|uniref:centrosomal protein CEP57L1 isoform X2 n=1 Tax=Syngnathoides biaculeatus TaxID=300417 RepID=UPI002ADE6DFB|nr:centrosomal protein CEP57L1 isoform X2 [Syngnathoides biaculeatus]